MSNYLQKAILSTLVYSDLFDYPLTKEEIETWLINCQIAKLLNCQIIEEIKELIKQKKIGNLGTYYYLTGRQKIVEIRQNRETYSKEKIKLAENVAEIMRRIPFVKMVAVSGGLASLNSEKNDDIDFIIITSKNRLFTARALIILILKIMGKYRSPDKIANMICPNMFLSEDSLLVKPKDLYLAHEILLVKPLVNKDKTYEKFIQVNSWVKKYLPNRYLELESTEIVKQKNKTPVPILSGILDIKEIILRRLQLWYMKPKRTTEVISSKVLKFHPQDVRLKILDQYQEKLKRMI